MFVIIYKNMNKIPELHFPTSNPLIVFGNFGECRATVKGDGFVAGPVKAETEVHKRASLDLQGLGVKI